MNKRLFLALVVLTAFGATNAVAPAASSVTVSFKPSGTLTGSTIVMFSQSVEAVTASNVVIRLTGGTTDLGSTVTCSDGSAVATSCEIGDVRSARVSLAKPLTAGQRYTIIVNPDGASPVMDKTLQAVSQATQNFQASMTEEESSVGASYSWATFTATKALGGSYNAERLQGASFTFGFTGTAVTWVTKAGPAQGRASVFIDGVDRGIVNLYSASDHYQVKRTYSGLSAGAHSLMVRVRGERGSTHGTSTWIALDGLLVNGTTVSRPVVHFEWQPVHDSSASGGRYVRTVTPNAHVSFVFRGYTIDWVTLAGPTQGKASMYIDGVKKRTVDNYSSSVHHAVTRRISDLTDAVHTLTIVAASGIVSVDRFVVRLSDVTVFRHLGTWVDLFDYSLDPATTVPTMRSRGVKTIYIETARYNSSADIDYPTQVGQWIDSAHAAGLRVVGWYFPAYSTSMTTDIRRTVAIAKYRSPGGERFDAFGIDIEYHLSSETRAQWFTDIGTHLAKVRAAIGAAYAVGAIVPAPLAMDINPSSWTGFPWSAIGKYANAVLPMGYWSYRTDCATDPDHCPYGYAVGNIKEARANTGLPVHLIGGIADKVTAQGVADFIKGAKDAKGYGASLYDYRTTTNSSFWTILAGANAL
jgi:hypothetical protein